jgi:3-hydroxymyristoyl/3-hydroxydecanoyl-(acyl carrier protein) dehydratase
MSLTPHGPGFSFLDGFELLTAGTSGRGWKQLDPHAAYFADHFPGEPLMPGVLLVECAAQAAGALWGSILAAEAPARFTLAQIATFKVQRAVRPGVCVETLVTLEKSFGALAQFEVTLSVAGDEVARGRLVLSRPGE